jgi:hypothetical protein
MWVLAAAALLVAALTWAQPSRVGCGPGQAGCGPAVVVVSGTTTTTLPGTAAPSWVSSMLAAWMLDEASGPRVNAQGVTTRNLVPNVAIGNDPVNKMEGAAAAIFDGTGQDLSFSGTELDGLKTTSSVGCWVQRATGDWRIMAYWGAIESQGWRLYFITGLNRFSVDPNSGDATDASPQPIGAWAHLVGTWSSPATGRLYRNGALVGSVTQTITIGAATQTFHLSRSDYTPQTWQGLLDECFVTTTALSATSICRICSCGIRGEQCTCNGTAFVSTGRNATACGSCTLPADCSAGAPS